MTKLSLPTTQVNTGGLYGSAQLDGNFNFNPNNFQKNLVSQTEQGLLNATSQLINPTYDSAVFQAQTAQRNKLANQSFENNLINPLASRGLTRGSSVAQMSNSFAKTLADAETNAMAAEDQRQANLISQLQNLYQLPYETMSGLNNLGNAQQNMVYSVNQANHQMKSNELAQLISSGAQLGMLSGSALLSDQRVKENLKLLEKVDRYRIYLFDFKNGPKNQVGVIAQEIQELSPEAVMIAPDGLLAVDYDLLPEEVLERIDAWRAALNSVDEDNSDTMTPEDEEDAFEDALANEDFSDKVFDESEIDFEEDPLDEEILAAQDAPLNKGDETIAPETYFFNRRQK